MARPTTEIIVPVPVLRSERDKKRSGTRRERYQYDVKPEINRGKNPLIFPGEAIQFLLDKQGIDVEEFNKKLGYAPTYFQSNVFNTSANDGSHRLSKPLCKKMALLTDTTEEFWQRQNFDADTARTLHINMKADLDAPAKMEAGFYMKNTPRGRF